MSKVIGILSGKGGVGKTALVANLGAALTKQFDKQVVIVDTNVNASHLGLHLGMYNSIPVTLRELLKKKVPLSHGIYVHPTTGVRILPAPLNGLGTKMTPRKLRSITNKIAGDYEMVLMDCAPGLGKEVVTSIGAMDAAIVMTTPDFPSVVDVMKTLELLNKLKKNVIGIVVNKSNNEKHELSIREIESTCGKRVIATIPNDWKVSHGVSEGEPAVVLSPSSKSSVAIKKLAGKLVGKDYEISIIDRVKGAIPSKRKSKMKMDEKLDVISETLKKKNGKVKRKNARGKSKSRK